MQIVRNPSSGGGLRRRGGFTLFEITLVVLILGIVAGIVVAGAMGDLHSSRLSVAANVLASDIEFCQSECINRVSTPRSVVFNVAGNSYSVVDKTSGTAISHPGDGMPFTNDFSTGRNMQLAGVTVTAATMGGANFTTLTFDSYGRPVDSSGHLITSAMTITLAYNGSALTVTIAGTTGDVTISGASDSSNGLVTDNGQNKDNGIGNKNGV